MRGRQERPSLLTDCELRFDNLCMLADDAIDTRFVKSIVVQNFSTRSKGYELRPHGRKHVYNVSIFILFFYMFFT